MNIDLVTMLLMILTPEAIEPKIDLFLQLSFRENYAN